MSNKLFTNRLKAITLAALLIALLSTIVFAQATSPRPASANPQASQDLKLDSQSFEFLKTKRAEAETAKDLTDPVRKQVIDQLDRAISFLEETDRLETELQSYTRQVQQAPTKIQEIKSKLSQKSPSFDKETELAGASDMPIEAIEQRVREGKAALAAAQGSLNSRQDQLAKLKKSPPIMQTAISDAKTRIQELKMEFEGVHVSDASKALDESRQAVLITEQTKLQTSIRFYDQALLNHEVLLSLLTAELDLANYEVTILEAKTKAWVEFAQKGRKLEASSARMDAEVAKKTAPDLPKAIKEQYDINIALGKDLEKVTTDEARAARTLDRRKSELKLLERDFGQARQLLQSDYLSESMGLSLRRYRQNLPNPDSYLKDSGKRQLIISQLSEAQFELDEKRRGQLDIHE